MPSMHLHGPHSTAMQLVTMNQSDTHCNPVLMGKVQTGSWRCAHTEMLEGESALAAAPKHTVDVFGKVKS